MGGYEDLDLYYFFLYIARHARTGGLRLSDFRTSEFLISPSSSSLAHIATASLRVVGNICKWGANFY